MRAAWVRQGHPGIPDGTKMHKYGIDTLYYDATDPVVDSAYLDEIRALHIKVGITRDPVWGGLNAVTLARTMDADLVRLGSGSGKQCYVIADIEGLWARPATYVLDWLTEWRKLRPTRFTTWTTEPVQGGAVSDALAARINADLNLKVAPQTYYDGMVPEVTEQVAMEMSVADGQRRAIHRDKIKIYYDAQHMPAAWDGIAFDFDKLP